MFLVKPSQISGYVTLGFRVMELSIPYSSSIYTPAKDDFFFLGKKSWLQ